MNEQLHVAFDARMPERPSGVGVYTRELLGGLARVSASKDVRLVAIAHPAQPLPEGVERLATDVRFDAHGPAELFEHVTLPRQLAERKVHVMHGPNTIVPLGAVPFARAVTIHDVAFARFGETLPPKFRLLMRVRTATSLQVADVAIAVSRFTADELRTLYPQHADRVVAVQSGTPQLTIDHVDDPRRARVLLNELGLVPRRYYCAIGTLEPRKNLPMLLRAMGRANVEL